MKAGDISPLVGMTTGEGLTGELMARGAGGLAPMMIARQAQKRRRKDEKSERPSPLAVARAAGMREGGETSKAKKKSSSKPRGCGCAKKGMRKAKMY